MNLPSLVAGASRGYTRGPLTLSSTSVVVGVMPSYDYRSDCSFRYPCPTPTNLGRMCTGENPVCAAAKQADIEIKKPCMAAALATAGFGTACAVCVYGVIQSGGTAMFLAEKCAGWCGCTVIFANAAARNCGLTD